MPENSRKSPRKTAGSWFRGFLLGVGLLSLTGWIGPVQAGPGRCVIKPSDELVWSLRPTPGKGGQPITLKVKVEADGKINLGPYGAIHVAGLTREQAKAAIDGQMARALRTPAASPATASRTIKAGDLVDWSGEGSAVPSGLPLSGHGTVSSAGLLDLGRHGTVHVAGLTMEQAQAAIEKRLALSISSGVPSSEVVPAGYRPAQGSTEPPLTLAKTESGPPPFRMEGESSLLAAEDVPQPPKTPANEPAAAPPPKGPKPMPNAPPATLPAPVPEQPKEPKPTPTAPESASPAALPPAAAGQACPAPGPHSVPQECRLTLLPPYIIQPPDILLVESTQSLRDQPVRGQHLVRPDGSISLGIYGSAMVAGLTLEQAREAIAQQIGLRVKELDPNNVNVDVVAYNSKVYYVITDGGGYGEQVIRLPITGNETVLDAISQINGLPAVSSKKHIWVARPVCGPQCHNSQEILAVNWCAITQHGSPETNYQILPGDRVYVKADRWITFDSKVAKVLAPFERMLGITLLGSETVNSIKGQNGGLGGGLGR